jgi:hypothetical protein
MSVIEAIAQAWAFASPKTGVDECDDDVRYLISSKCREAGIHRYRSVPERWLTVWELAFSPS